MTHPALKNNHEIHKASIVKWYCPNLMGSDTSNYPLVMVLTSVNLYKYPAKGGQSDAAIKPMRLPHEPTWLSSSHWEQTMHVSVQWVHWGRPGVSVMRLMISQCQCWHCHILVTLSCLAWHRVTILHHVTRSATSPKLWVVSRHLIGPRLSVLASDWLLITWPWLVICIILASLACDDWARLSTLMIMNIHRLKNGLPVMSDFWDIQISNVIIMTPEISRQHHYMSPH